jgi:Flp pilus assembly pilin Flp
MKRRFKHQKGQAIVEYVILVVVVALTAFFVLVAFSTRLRDLITGTTVALGGEPAETADKDVGELVKELGADGEVN